jgi:predicted ATPase
MPAALAQHDTLLQNAVAEHQGRIFKTAGDAVCAVFADAASAALAALAAQRGLAAMTWNEFGLGDRLTVRMAIHAGAAQEHGDDFSGPVLNRLSRLLAAGHGGQILLAGAVADQIAGALPAGSALRDLGQRRLRDVPGTERIVQLAVDGLPSTFPPLRTLETIANNLPAAPTPCIGREAERARLRVLFPRSEVRLVTLLGPGGIGKTRLALQAATDLLDEFPDGVWFVDLTAVREPELVAGAVVRSLGIREEAGKTTEEAMLSWLEQRELLLVLDNCEQVIEGAAQLAAEVLRQTRQVRLLATSRVPLGVRGEQRLPVEPLALPGSEKAPDPQRIQETASVRLFVARASAVKPSFALSNANAPHVAEICRRVDGIPLALELAAARITVLSPEALRERLDRRLHALGSGSRDLPERHKTLRNAIRWSYELLSDQEQVVFRRLAVFAGGWSLPAAEAVLGNGHKTDLLDTLESLAAQSLIRAEPGEQEAPRFSMLETIREFALERLVDAGEEERFREAHADYFLQLAEDIAPKLSTGIDHGHLLDRLERDHHNLRTAFDYHADRRNAVEALRFGSALWLFWSRRGWLSEGRRWLEIALALSGESHQGYQGAALRSLGNLSVHAGDISTAVSLYERSYAIAMTSGDKDSIGRALCNLGLAALLQGRWDDAREFLDRDVRLCEEIGDAVGVATAKLNLGMNARDSGNPQLALLFFESSRSLHVRQGNEYGVAYATYHIGLTCLDLHEWDRAGQLLQSALQIFKELSDLDGIACAEQGLSLLWIERGDIDVAEKKLTEILEFRMEQGDRRGIAECCEALALAAGQSRKLDKASNWLAQSRAWREAAGIVIPAGDARRIAQLENLLSDQIGDLNLARLRTADDQQLFLDKPTD